MEPMFLRFSVLASGSSGNASLIEGHSSGLLLDLGLGPRQLIDRLEVVSASWDHIGAAVLTHTHADHWKERTFALLEKRGIPLYCHAEHMESLAGQSPAFAGLRAAGLVRFYEIGVEVEPLPGLTFIPFPVAHDGGVTCGFRFEAGPHALGYAADLGSWGPELVQALANVDVLAIEFNHDVSLEMNSGRSSQLIARVLGDDGHLSNEQAADLVREIMRCSEPGRPQHLVQLHLSRECNHPELAREAGLAAVGSRNIRVHTARQHHVGPSVVMKGTPAPTCTQAWLPGWD
jgi:phosphoribosyl 1,2-cyclic phosphodiesterase